MDWYVDLVNGSDSNAGTSWGTARETLNGLSATALAPNDTVKIAKTDSPTNSGFVATSVQGNDFITIDPLLDCPYVFRNAKADNMFGANGAQVLTAGEINAIPVTSVFDIDGWQTVFDDLTLVPHTKYSYYQLDTSANYTSYSKIQFWIRLNQAAVDSWSNLDLKVAFCSDVNGDVPVTTMYISLPAKSTMPMPVILDNVGFLPAFVQSVALYSGPTPTLVDGSAVTLSAMQVLPTTPVIQYGDWVRMDTSSLWFSVALIEDSGAKLYVHQKGNTALEHKMVVDSNADLLLVMRPTWFDFSDFPVAVDGVLDAVSISVGGSDGSNRVIYSGGWDTGTDMQDGYTILEVVTDSASLLTLEPSVNFLRFMRMLCSGSRYPVLTASVPIELDLQLDDFVFGGVGLGNSDTALKNLNFENVKMLGGTGFEGLKQGVIMSWNFFSSVLNSVSNKSQVTFQGEITWSATDMENCDFELNLDGITTFIGTLLTRYSTLTINAASTDGHVTITDTTCYDSIMGIYCNGHLSDLTFNGVEHEPTALVFDPGRLGVQFLQNSGQNMIENVTGSNLWHPYPWEIRHAKADNLNLTWNGPMQPPVMFSECDVAGSTFTQENADSEFYFLSMENDTPSPVKFTNCLFSRATYSHQERGARTQMFTCEFTDTPLSLYNIGSGTVGAQGIMMSNCLLQTGFDPNKTPWLQGKQSPTDVLSLHKYNKTVADHRLIFDKGNAVTDDSEVHSPGGRAWRLTVDTSVQLVEDETQLEIAQVAIRGGQPFSASLYVKVMNATGQIALKAWPQQFEDGQTELRAISATTGAWELLQIGFTPAENGVLVIYVTPIASAGDEVIHYDDFSATQA